MTKTKPYLRAGEAAALLRVTARTIYRWADLGQLPYTRTLHGHRRYKLEDVKALAARFGITEDGGEAA